MSETSLQFWPATDVGKVRTHNEDSFLIDKKLNLFVVCDGMGGHAAGDVASSMASRELRDALAADPEVSQVVSNQEVADTRDSILLAMESAVQKACAAVHQAGEDDPQKRGMGTTLDALLIVGHRGFIAHVGDSRIYLYRQGAVHQLTEDHSVVNELLRRGKLTRDQIDKVQYKNAVTRAVGVYRNVDPDVFDFDVLPGDRFLLCSDGLHGYFEEHELGRLFEEVPEGELATRLVALANERGGKDNITAVVVRVPEGRGGIDEIAQEVNLKLEILHRIPLFRFISYQELVRVLNITHVRSYQPGEVIVREGEEGEEFFVVLKGRVRVHSGENTLVELSPGQHFGEMALVDKSPRSASVTAVERSRVLTIRRRDFFALIRKEHAIATKLLWSFCGVLAQRLRTTSEQLAALKAGIVED
ncbi:MAG: Stp1/IreP family PP2C-type Ser/Thr phosphatase [Myxococcales bacterium]|nr:Stp1/IreP family PP2C-type Ser/Thr phosphatase [Myxococcales bacterium]